MLYISFIEKDSQGDTLVTRHGALTACLATLPVRKILKLFGRGSGVWSTAMTRK